jgi:hypothetical protein
MEDEEEAVAPRPSLASRGCGYIGCLLLIGILVALGAGVYFLGNALEPLADRFLWAPHDVVREYIDAYEDDNSARARRFLCAEIRGGPLLDPAAPLGGGDVWTRGAVEQFPYPRPGGQVGIYYELHLPIRDARGQALVQRQDDGWRICALQ